MELWNYGEDAQSTPKTIDSTCKVIKNRTWDIVTRDGVFVCGHNVSIFSAAKIRIIRATYFRTDAPSILFIKFRIRHVCLPWTMTRFGA